MILVKSCPTRFMFCFFLVYFQSSLFVIFFSLNYCKKKKHILSPNITRHFYLTQTGHMTPCITSGEKKVCPKHFCNMCLYFILQLAVSYCDIWVLRYTISNISVMERQLITAFILRCYWCNCESVFLPAASNGIGSVASDWRCKCCCCCCCTIEYFRALLGPFSAK